MMHQVPRRLRRSFSAATILAAFCMLVGAPPTDAEPDGTKGLIAELPFLDRIEGFGRATDHIAIDVGKDRPLPMLLDTGATHTVMTPRYARAVGIAVRRERGRPHLRETRLGRKLEIHVLDGSSDTGHGAGAIGDLGLIGMDFLREFAVDIDYQARVVRFYDRRKWRLSDATALDGEWLLPLLRIDARPALALEIGEGTNRFIVDTGAALSLLVAEERLAELGLRAEFEEGGTGESFGRNLYGDDRLLERPLPRVRIGDHVVTAPGLLVAAGQGSTFRVTNAGGPDRSLLGNHFLKRFRVRLDFGRRRIGLTPLAAEPEQKR